jgi:hypothetical protein
MHFKLLVLASLAVVACTILLCPVLFVFPSIKKSHTFRPMVFMAFHQYGRDIPSSEDNIGWLNCMGFRAVLKTFVIFVIAFSSHLSSRHYCGCMIPSIFFLFLTLILLSEIGTTCFSSCCGKDSAIFLTTGRPPDVNPPWNSSRDQQLNVSSEARRSSIY